jgi:hypothetical protein
MKVAPFHIVGNCGDFWQSFFEKGKFSYKKTFCKMPKICPKKLTE